MGNLTFYLNDTTIEQLEKWLSRYTRRASGLYPNENGPWSISSSNFGSYPPRFSDYNINPDLITIGGYHIKETKNGVDMGFPIEMARFETMEFGRRLEVKITHKDGRDLIAYFGTLFIEMATAWPEASQVINEYIVSYLQSHGIEIPKQNDVKTQNENKENSTKKPYVPIQKKNLDKWKRAFQIIIELRREYRDEWELSDKNPNPKIGDYRDAIINRLNLEYSERNIGRIIKAGDAGLLK